MKTRDIQHRIIGGDGDSFTVEMGSDEFVTLDKVFGPTIFQCIRIQPNSERVEWVIERYDSKSESWKQCALIPGQLPEDFDENIVQ